MATRDLATGERFRVWIYPDAANGFADSLHMRDEVIDVGEAIARDARYRAVKRTGDGARSIRAWPGRDSRGWYADVSWDQDHFYMGFHEWGTRKFPARPAVEPAFDHYLMRS